MRLEDLNPKDMEISPELRTKCDELLAALKNDRTTYWKSAEIVRLAVRMNRIAAEVMRSVGWTDADNPAVQGAFLGVIATHGRSAVEGDPPFGPAEIAELIHQDLHLSFMPGPHEEMPRIVLTRGVGGPGTVQGHGFTLEEAAAHLVDAIRCVREGRPLGTSGRDEPESVD